MQPVEIFKTNIDSKEKAEEVLDYLSGSFPSYQINFDLEDCDNVLRVVGNEICVEKILHAMTKIGYHCELITD